MLNFMISKQLLVTASFVLLRYTLSKHIAVESVHNRDKREADLIHVAYDDRLMRLPTKVRI